MAAVSLLGIGVSGLNASQLQLATTGHNVSNAGTPGYSRQRVDLAAQYGTVAGIGSLGAGVRPIDVSRVTDQLVTNQIRTDTSGALDVKTFLDGAGQLDNLFANESTGLSPGLDRFFGAISAASADPTSIPARRLVLTEAQGLTTRFHALADRLEEQGTTLAGQFTASAAHITILARDIAGVNEAIGRAGGINAAAQLPNDLLDKRDELLRQLAEEVQTRVVTQGDGQLSVFVGNGLGLVVGVQAREVVVADGGNAILLRDGQHDQRIDNTLSGGRIGGLLRLKHSVIDTALNSLGRISQVVGQTVNAQLANGIDLAGHAGGPLFGDINSAAAMAARVTRIAGNPTADLHVHIDDATAIPVSDYEVAFLGPSNNEFEIKRQSDGATVYRGSVSGVFPQTATFDHLTLTFAAGSFSAGDSFVLQPTRLAAREFSTVLTAPGELALASPLRTTAAIGNRGSGHIDGADVLDITQAAFAKAGKLAPPLLIRFTSASTYDVLDGTDPLKPKPLVPPLTGLPFVAGTVNSLLPEDPGQRIVTGDGARIGRVPASATNLTTVEIAAGNTPSNGYLGEALTFVATDPTTQQTTTTVVSTPPSGSAASVANSINGVRGVSARAISAVNITALHAAAGAAVVIDGQSFGGAALNDLGALADALNANVALRDAGVSARSDGTQLLLSNAHGADLRVFIKGASSDTIQLADDAGNSLTLQGLGAGSPAQLAGNVDRSAGFDFSTGGPYTFGLSVDGGPVASLALTGIYSSGAQLVSGLQAQIDASAIGAGHLTVAIDGAGHINVTSTSTGEAAHLALSNAPAGSPIALALGIVNAASAGSDQYQAATIGGRVAVALNSGLQMSAQEAQPGGSLFTAGAIARNSFLGYQVRASGVPVAGDAFQVTFNSNGSSDNRNAIALAGLQTKALVGNGSATYADGYAEIVQFVGAKTSGARVDADAADSLLKQSTALRDGLAGVNLDEEAANLLRFQQAYAASARVISTARELFNSLLSIFN